MFAEGSGFRHRARLSVRGRARSPKIGIFREGTHELVDIPRCVVHHPLINEVVSCLKQAVKATQAPPYSDRAHAGLIRAVQVVVERASQTAQVVVVANRREPTDCEPLLNALAEALGPRLQSLWFNGNPEQTNRILGEHWSKYQGADAVEDVVGGAQVFYPPDAFGQANPELAGVIVERIHGWVPPGARVLELYAGVGAIGLGLLGKVHSITFNEVGGGSLRGLRLGLARQSAQPAPGFGDWSVIEGPAERAAAAAEKADVVIVDPPRKGLGDEVLSSLHTAAPERLIYLSCGLDSFEREAEELSRTYRLETTVVYGLFPFTDHVETLALFRRRHPAQ